MLFGEGHTQRNINIALEELLNGPFGQVQAENMQIIDRTEMNI